MNSRLIAAALLAVTSLSASAAVQEKTVEYKDGDTVLKGYLYWDDAVEKPRPGVLVVHEWWGLNAYARKRARMLAEAGFVAFTADMYGDNRITEHPNEAAAWRKEIIANVDAWQQRARAGLDQLAGARQVDPKRMAAIGYCFGGATVMQMAYAGMDLKGVASFHGSLPVPTPEQAGKIKASILVAHGEEDKFVPAEQIVELKKALTDGGADWEMDIYGGARHSFTVPDADMKGIENLKYDPKADRRSWARLLVFLSETLQ